MRQDESRKRKRSAIRTSRTALLSCALALFASCGDEKDPGDFGTATITPTEVDKDVGEEFTITWTSSATLMGGAGLTWIKPMTDLAVVDSSDSQLNAEGEIVTITNSHDLVFKCEAEGTTKIVLSWNSTDAEQVNDDSGTVNVKCSAPTGPGGSVCTASPCTDPTDDCKVTSVGMHQACPSAQAHVDIVQASATCAGDGVDILLTLASPVPLDPEQRFEMNFDFQDASGGFAAGLTVIYQSSTQDPIMSGTFLSPGAGDSAIRTEDGNILVHLSNETIAASGVDLSSLLCGSYDYNGGEDVWDETSYFPFPACQQ